MAVARVIFVLVTVVVSGAVLAWFVMQLISRARHRLARLEQLAATEHP